MRALAVILALLSVTAHAATLAGRVLNISDGDTLTLIDATNRQYKIHLAGIDAPELTQDFGQKSRTNLSALAFNQQAIAECMTDNRNQQALCVVSIGGKDVGLEQLRAGMAWYRQENVQQTAKERADYEYAEFNAKIRRLGLWNSKNPTPPWDWRRGSPAH